MCTMPDQDVVSTDDLEDNNIDPTDGQCKLL